MSQFFESADGSRRNLRIALFAIILLTLPFYCIGFVLWSVAPQTPGASIPTRVPSATSQTREPSPTAGATLTLPPFVTPTGLSPLLPTPIQFYTPTPGGGNPVFPPTSVPPTIFIPPPTIAPTLTFVPPPPTSTPIPPPSNTPIPPPSNTPVPPPTVEVATSTTIPFPTDTETPTEMFSAAIEVAPENSQP